MPSSTPLSMGNSGISVSAFAIPGATSFSSPVARTTACIPRVLIDLKQARGEMESPGIGENMLEHQPRDPVRRTLTDNLGAGIFHHLAEMNARRTDGLAGAAIEASEHVLAERSR